LKGVHDTAREGQTRWLEGGSRGMENPLKMERHAVEQSHLCGPGRWSRPPKDRKGRDVGGGGISQHKTQKEEENKFVLCLTGVCKTK